MKNSTSFFVPVIVGTLFVLLGFGCWYIGPSKHATMLQYGQLAELDVDSGRQSNSAKNSLGNCEKCKKPLRTVHGKFGDFVGCSGYPACKYIKREKASFVCPECKGAIEKRVWSGGTLWGCSNYPDCRFAIFSDIEDTACGKCKASLYLLKKVDIDGKIVLTCPNEQCVEEVK